MSAHFPAICVTEKGQGFEAVAGLGLHSILTADLAGRPEEIRPDSRATPAGGRRQQLLHAGREALLLALAGMEPGLSLELHLDARPDLAVVARSRCQIVLCIRGTGRDRRLLQEKILGFSLALRPLLAAHLPEAEFLPLGGGAELREFLAARQPARAVAVRRRRQVVRLDQPLQRGGIGFTAGRPPAPPAAGAEVAHLFPWMPAHDDWADLVNTLLAQLEPGRIVIRLATGGCTGKARTRLLADIAATDNFLVGPNAINTTLRLQAELIRKLALQRLARLEESSFRVGVFLLADQATEATLARVLARSITRLQSELDGADLLQGGFALRTLPARLALKSGFFDDPEPFTLSEAASAFRLPAPPALDIPGLPIRHFRTSLALLPDLARPDSVTLAVNDHRGITQEIRLGPDDRMRHLALFGQTGTGKTTMLEQLILQDIQAGRGVAVIDPHGDLVDSLLGRIPEERIKEVVLFDFLEPELPVGFNLLEWESLEERDLIIDELYRTLDHLYDLRQTGGPIFESNIRGMLKLLMGDEPRNGFIPTILEFSRCYLDQDFRKWLAKSISDQTTLDFLEELERTCGEASLKNLSPYVTSKFNRFINDTILRRIVGQSRTTLDFTQIMDEGRILLVKLGKGRFGGTISGLLANQIVSRFKFAAMRRAGLSPEARRDFLLYVDECHNLPPENFIELLAEARKYRLGLVLATQYTAQLTRSSGNGRDDLLSAILGNVGTTVAFRLGKSDAELLEPVFYPHFRARDIMALPNHHGYISAGIGGGAIPPFSFRGVRNDSPFSAPIAKVVLHSSRTRYGQEAAAVDYQINLRRQAGK